MFSPQFSCMPPIQYKGRVIQLIAPTAADVERYQKLAENAGAPLSKYLLAVLRRGPSHDYQLLEALGIQPSDRDLMRAVNEQLELLELHGVITGIHQRLSITRPDRHHNKELCSIY